MKFVDGRDKHGHDVVNRMLMPAFPPGERRFSSWSATGIGRCRYSYLSKPNNAASLALTSARTDVGTVPAICSPRVRRSIDFT